MAATTQPRDPNNLPSIVANSDGTAGVANLDSAGNLRVVGRKGTLTTEKQVTVSSTPVQLLPANLARDTATFVGISGTGTVYLGSTNAVSATTAAFYIAAGNQLDDDITTNAWWAVCPTNSLLVGVAEVS